MPVTIDGTTGVTTPGATVGSITGILKASSGVVAQAVAGTDYLTSSSGGAITLATAQTATGTAIDFTGIPSWAKRITVMLDGVSTNGTSPPILRLGDSGGVETTGYLGSNTLFAATTMSTTSISTGFDVMNGSHAAATIINGLIIVSLLNSSTNTWSCNGGLGISNTNWQFIVSGSKSLSATLDRVRITTVNGTDTFDAGTINISYE